jgi:hypothetical protein
MFKKPEKETRNSDSSSAGDVSESDIPVTNNFGLFCLFPVWWIFLYVHVTTLFGFLFSLFSAR